MLSNFQNNAKRKETQPMCFNSNMVLKYMYIVSIEDFDDCSNRHAMFDRQPVVAPSSAPCIQDKFHRHATQLFVIHHHFFSPIENQYNRYRTF